MFEPTKISGLRRGHKAKTISSGIVGMVGGICQMMNGSVQIEIRPLPGEGATEAPKSVWVDEQEAVFVEQYMEEQFRYADTMRDLKMGDVVCCSVSGFEGTITQIVLYINGCISCEVTPRTDYATNSPQPAWMDQHRLKLVGESRLPPTHNPKGGAPEMRGDRGRHV